MPDATEDQDEAIRPRRPSSVELAAAILVVGSAMDIVISLEAFATSTGEARLLAGASILLGLWLVILGILVRRGRAWLAGVNIVAVAAFLELATMTFTGVLAGLLDVLVVGLLFRGRWWFAWKPPDPPDAATNAVARPRLRGRDA